MQPSKAAKVFTWGTFLIVIAISLGHALQSSLLSELIDYYHLQSAAQGAIGSFQSIGGLVGLLLPILLVNRMKKPIMVFGVALLEIVSLLLIGLKPSHAVFLALYLLFGVAKGMSDGVMTPVLSDLHGGPALARYIGIQQGVFGVGALLTPLFVSLLMGGGVGWNGVYMAAALLTAIMCAVYAVICRSTAKLLPFALGEPQPLSLRAMAAFFRIGRDRQLLLSAFCFAVSQIAFYLWIGRYIQVKLGNPALGQAALAAYWIGTAVSRIGVPQLNLPPMRYIIFGSVASAAFSIAAILSSSPVIAVAFSFLTALSNGAAFPLQIYTVCSWHKDFTIMASTLTFMVFYAGLIVSPPIVGFVNDAAGLTAGMMICPLFALLSALCAAPLLRERM